jgi:hypothetical protein
MKRRSTSQKQPQWTRHLRTGDGITLCGLRPSTLHRAEDDDVRVDRSQVRECQRCIQLARER